MAKGIKTGGRKKGSKNKDTLMLEALGIVRIDDLQETLLALYTEGLSQSGCLQNGMPVRYAIALKLGSFVFPQKKEIDLKQDGNITVKLPDAN